MELTGEQRKKFREALIAAFPDNNLEIMLKDKCGKNLYDITSESKNNIDKVFDLIEHAESQGKLKELLGAAQSYNPGNPQLREFKNNYLNSLTQDEIENIKFVLKEIDFSIL
ncbi:hypothetical protein NIES2101_33235 [Calothrix sp. HK-06]|nr:hypothetical protein NIES2101_33235 [Calothrix sp. HK-06]